MPPRIIGPPPGAARGSAGSDWVRDSPCWPHCGQEVVARIDHAKGANAESAPRTRATDAGEVVDTPMAAAKATAEVRSGRRIASSKGPEAAQERPHAARQETAADRAQDFPMFGSPGKSAVPSRIGVGCATAGCRVAACATTVAKPVATYVHTGQANPPRRTAEARKRPCRARNAACSTTTPKAASRYACSTRSKRSSRAQRGPSGRDSGHLSTGVGAGWGAAGVVAADAVVTAAAVDAFGAGAEAVDVLGVGARAVDVLDVGAGAVDVLGGRAGASDVLGAAADDDLGDGAAALGSPSRARLPLGWVKRQLVREQRPARKSRQTTPGTWGRFWGGCAGGGAGRRAGACLSFKDSSIWRREASSARTDCCWRSWRRRWSAARPATGKPKQPGRTWGWAGPAGGATAGRQAQKIRCGRRRHEGGDLCAVRSEQWGQPPGRRMWGPGGAGAREEQ